MKFLKFEIISPHVGFLVVFITYIVGGYWLQEFYSAFGIDFFLYGGVLGVIPALFSNLDNLFYVLFWCFILLIVIAFELYLFLLLAKRNIKKGFAFKKQEMNENLLSIIKFFMLIVSFVFIIEGFNKFNKYMIYNIKSDIYNGRYQYYNMELDHESDVLNCIRTIGVIGDYRVLINPSSTSFLIKESEVKRITPIEISKCSQQSSAYHHS